MEGKRMSNRLYRVALKTDEESARYLHKCCTAYRKAFNASLKVQEKNMHYHNGYEEQLMNLDVLKDEITEETVKIRERYNVENGIVERAVEASYSYFNAWWNQRMCSLIKYIQPCNYMKKTDFFKTSTILKVSKGGYVYFPKFKRVKLYQNDYVPIGSYKNAKVVREGVRWYISFESTIEDEEEHNLSGELEVHIDSKGNVSFGDKFYANVIEQENYKETKAKRRKLIKDFKRKLRLNSYVDETGETVVKISNKMKLTKRSIEKAFYRMKYIQVEYFRKIVRDILSEEPAVLTFVYDTELKERTQFTSDLFRESGTLGLIKMIRTRMSSIGTEIRYSDNIKEEVYKKLNFKNTK